jgi:D-alanyl-D-alanine carboxypeptidase
MLRKKVFVKIFTLFFLCFSSHAKYSSGSKRGIHSNSYALVGKQCDKTASINWHRKLANKRKASIVIDCTNIDRPKVVFSQNPDAIRYPASLTKIMTVYLLFEALITKKINLGTRFKVSKFASMQMPTKLRLLAGEEISVLDIIRGLIIKSANDVAVVAAEGLCGSVHNFAAKMNKKAKQLGMTKTIFKNASGVPDNTQVTSARDIATLGIAIFKRFPQYWHFFSEKSFRHRSTTYQTHTKILKWYKGADGGKTGYIALSGFNLFVTACRKDKNGRYKRLVVVVMGEELSKTRDIYAAQLMNNHFAHSTTLPIEKTICTKNNKRKALESQIDLAQQVAASESLKILEIEEETTIDKILDRSAHEYSEIEEEITFDKILDRSTNEYSDVEDPYIHDEEIMDVLKEEEVLAILKK